MVKKTNEPPESYELVKEYLDSINQKENACLYDINLKKQEVLREIFRLNHQKTRYIQQLYKRNKIDKKLLFYLFDQRLIDRELIKLWSKPGMENLCCVQCLPESTSNGNSCICRVPYKYLKEDVFTGCKNCGCSGCSGY